MPGKILQFTACALLFNAAHPAFGFAPIPVSSIYPPLKTHGSADDALATGHVYDETYRMAAPASKPWRIAFLFPHLKDPYWVG